MIDSSDGLTGGNPVDAGARAAEMLKLRRERMAQVKKFITLGFIALFLVVLAIVSAAGVYVYKQVTVGYSSVERRCSITVGDQVFEGVRKYHYPYWEVMGIQIRQNDKVTEETRVTVKSQGVTVVGHTPTKWWSLIVDIGEPGNYLMKPADTYTFIHGDAVNVVGYLDFCLPGNGKNSVAKLEN